MPENYLHWNGLGMNIKSNCYFRDNYFTRVQYLQVYSDYWYTDVYFWFWDRFICLNTTSTKHWFWEFICPITPENEGTFSKPKGHQGLCAESIIKHQISNATNSSVWLIMNSKWTTHDLWHIKSLHTCLGFVLTQIYMRQLDDFVCVIWIF